MRYGYDYMAAEGITREETFTLPYSMLYQWEHLETGTTGTRIVYTRTLAIAEELIERLNRQSSTFDYSIVSLF